MAKSKSGGRRVGWSNLSETYRRRITGAGITREEWEAGVDLRQARGHTPAPPPYEAPVQILGGSGGRDDLRAVREWAESNLAPRWARGLDPDVAAALSQIPWPPGEWRDVVLTPRADGEAWSMRVIPKGRPNSGVMIDRNGNEHATTAYDVVIEIPGGGEMGSGARQVLDLLTFGPDDDDAEWPDELDFDIGESE